MDDSTTQNLVDRGVRSTGSGSYEDYEDLRVSIDGKSHKSEVLIAVFAGIFVAIVIVSVLVVFARKTEREFEDSIERLSNQSQIETISGKLSRSPSQISGCSGLVINGRVHCCLHGTPTIVNHRIQRSKYSSSESSIQEEYEPTFSKKLHQPSTSGQIELIEVVTRL